MHRSRKLALIILLTITALIGCEKSYLNRPVVPSAAPEDTTCVDPDEDDKD